MTMTKSATTTQTVDQAEDTCQACDQRMKSMPRSPELKRDVSCRINRVCGQLNGIKQMVNDDRYCGDVLTQLAAVESAVKAISREVMRDHLETCVVERVQAGDVDAVDEVIDLFKKFM
jgi:DNA-binding FrmR family transcriptional regulator